MAHAQFFVVHYHKLVDRRRYLEAQFAAAGASAVFVEIERSNPDLPRILYAGDELEWYRKVRDLYRPPPAFRRLSLAEIHNAASHIFAINSIDADWGVVIEDDAILAPDFFQSIERLSALPDPVDCVFVGGGFDHRVARSIGVGTGFHIKAHPATNTVVAYALRRELAATLARAIRGFDLPFDFELAFLLMAHNATVAHLLPYVAHEGSKSGVYESAIRASASLRTAESPEDS